MRPSSSRIVVVLPGAVGAEEAEHLALGDPQVEAVHGRRAAERLVRPRVSITCCIATALRARPAAIGLGPTRPSGCPH